MDLWKWKNFKFILLFDNSLTIIETICPVEFFCIDFRIGLRRFGFSIYSEPAVIGVVWNSPNCSFKNSRPPSASENRSTNEKVILEQLTTLKTMKQKRAMVLNIVFFFVENFLKKVFIISLVRIEFWKIIFNIIDYLSKKHNVSRYNKITIKW